MKTEPNTIQPAIDKAGGIKALARQLGVRYQAIQQWNKRQRPPAERCLAIEQATGVSRYDLRPDIYGPPAERRAA